MKVKYELIKREGNDVIYEATAVVREDIPVGKDFCFAGEVGLSGEIRPVNRVDQRIQEAEKLGFDTIFVSKYNKIALKNTGIKIELVAKIEDVASILFG